jgi:hypothetical protein
VTGPEVLRLSRDARSSMRDTLAAALAQRVQAMAQPRIIS